jgi:membrane protein implicated in regulation of membrane protease activity
MTWWGWMIIGAMLFGAELFAIDAQFYLVFLGISAALVGLFGLSGIAMPEWAQWLSFAALSLISMFTFRKALYMKIRGDAPGFKDGLAGERIKIKDDLSAGGTGSVDFRGSTWKVRNVGSKLIPAGETVLVVNSEGLTLNVNTD